MSIKAARQFGAAVWLAAAVLAPTKLAAQQETLVLEVDRFTGATTLHNPSENLTEIELISYTLNSPSNTLESSDEHWKSFEDAGEPGWFEANPTTANLSELATAAPLGMMPGTSHDFGTPFTVNTEAPLGTNRVNPGGASFRYLSPDGEEIFATTEIVGRFNDLVLVVNPADGFATLQNQSAQSIELISYTISSSSGSLLSSYAGSGEPDWFTANLTANDLSELSSGSSIVLNEGGEVDLGIAWSTEGDQDLTFVYQEPGEGTLFPGTVFFISAGTSGDYNGDAKVDAADYLVWRDNLGGDAAALGGNGSGGPTVGQADYELWVSNFGATSEVASTARAVPEPSWAILLVVLLTASIPRSGRTMEKL